MRRAILFVPSKAPSAPNLREHWAVRYRREKSQRRAVQIAEMSSGRPLKAMRGMARYLVEFERVGKRLLDTDNLQGSFKAFRDAVSSLLEIGDGPSDPAGWAYSQRKSMVQGVVISVTGWEAQEDIGHGK